MPEPSISLIHTSARPKRVGHTSECWALRSDDATRIEHVITYDRTTFVAPPQPVFEHSIFKPQDDFFEPTKVSPVAGWNRAARLSTGKILMLVSDDYFPPMHWDSLVIEAIGDVSRETVLWVRNVAYIPQNIVTLWHHLICHPIMTRAYYERLGYFFHPSFHGRGCDNEFTEVAQRDRVIIDAREKLFFIHQDLHPAYEPLEENEANAKVSEHYQKDWETYLARQRAGFPKEWK